jgi:hypothetical protein
VEAVEVLVKRRAKVTMWSWSSLPQETWGSVAEGGVRCSKSLVDMYTALCSVAEENARVAAAHVAYAALLEKALSKVALQHVVSLEKLCQARVQGSWESTMTVCMRAASGQHICGLPKCRLSLPEWRRPARLHREAASSDDTNLLLGEHE